MSITKEIAIDQLANPTKCSTLGPDIETCCREKGVIDVCIGYCFKKGGSIGRSITGICTKWFSTIKDCFKGTFIY